MAKPATSNQPKPEHVQEAVREIEDRYDELASERGSYMLKCRRIREVMAANYDKAGDRGISKKLLKLIIQERALEKKIDSLALDLQPDERSELEVLMESLGDFASTGLGMAAVAKMNLVPPAAQ